MMTCIFNMIFLSFWCISSFFFAISFVEAVKPRSCELVFENVIQNKTFAFDKKILSRFDKKIAT